MILKPLKKIFFILKHFKNIFSCIITHLKKKDKHKHHKKRKSKSRKHKSYSSDSSSSSSEGKLF